MQIVKIYNAIWLTLAKKICVWFYSEVKLSDADVINLLEVDIALYIFQVAPHL